MAPAPGDRLIIQQAAKKPSHVSSAIVHLKQSRMLSKLMRVALER
ncbi:hypothetical protein PSYJA_27474 [Pseudomonas syringae pv. japonica str. M301072]|uniref:Uncharacterized protein n=2 Tax=Pseudomonas syringae TaxID=317 RepID=F3FQK9_PSESX|nr:hypothetical protein PSYJA_27474 [Pseudomonas syringae pv. japonica str. M301072]